MRFSNSHFFFSFTYTYWITARQPKSSKSQAQEPAGAKQVCFLVLVARVNISFEQAPRPTGSLDKLDVYIEKLYESVEEQIKAATLILDLAQLPANLEELVNDGINYS